MTPRPCAHSRWFPVPQLRGQQPSSKPAIQSLTSLIGLYWLLFEDWSCQVPLRGAAKWHLRHLCPVSVSFFDVRWKDWKNEQEPELSAPTWRLFKTWLFWCCWRLLEKILPDHLVPLNSLMVKPKPSSGTGRNYTVLPEAELAKQISIQTNNKLPLACKKLSIWFLDGYLSIQRSFYA